MKTPREILLHRHRNAEPQLDAIRRTALKRLDRQDESSIKSPFAMFIQRLASSLSPHPAAWGALAVIWILIFALNTASQSHTPQLAKNSTRPSPEMVAGLKEQQKILAELMGSSELPAIERPKRFPAQPHSERREEMRLV